MGGGGGEGGGGLESLELEGGRGIHKTFTNPPPLRGEIPRGCPGFTTPQAVNSVFTRTIASAKS